MAFAIQLKINNISLSSIKRIRITTYIGETIGFISGLISSLIVMFNLFPVSEEYRHLLLIISL